jgi:hypothetical protein
MALYSNGTPTPTSPASPPRRVTGQYLAKAHLTKRQRAKLAADLTTGTAVINPLTVKQAAAVARVPVFNVSRARRNGKRGNGRNGHGESLAEHFARCTEAERAEAARAIGIDVVWDRMISPVLAEERVNQQAAE